MSDALRIIPLGGLGEVGKNMTLYELGGRAHPDRRRPRVPARRAPRRRPRPAGLLVPRGPAAARDRAHPRARGPRRRAAVRAARGRGGRGDRRRGSRSRWSSRSSTSTGSAPRPTLTRGRSRTASGDAARPLPARVRPHGALDPRLRRDRRSRPPAGRVLHTGDWKLDHTPVDGLKTDVGKLAEIGNRGVDLMLGDSTNAERPGMTGSERLVGEAFRQLIPRSQGRILSRASRRTSTGCSRRPRSRSRTTARSRSSAARCGRT